MWRKAALAVLATLASLGCLELAVRLLVPDPAARVHFAVKSAGCCRLDDRLLWTLVPGASGSWGTDEFTETMHVDALGLRGGEVPPRRPGELRILAAGDSFTYGHGMSDVDAYPAVLERLLRAGGADATVLNAGVPGYSLDQTYRAVVERWLALGPDLVVVGVHCSDVSYDADMSLYDVADGRLVEIPTATSWVLLQGRIDHALPRPIRKLKSMQYLLGTLERTDPFGRIPAAARADVGAWMRGKIALELADLDARGRRDGFAALAVIMPCKQDLVGGDRTMYGDLPRRLDEARVRWIDAGRTMRERGVAGRDVFFARDWHLNVAGNRLLAAIVAGALPAPLARPARTPAGEAANAR